MVVSTKSLGMMLLVIFPALDVVPSTLKNPEDQHSRAIEEITRLGGFLEPKMGEDGHDYLMMTTDGRWRGGDAGLVHIKSLRGLEKLRLGGEITDAGLAHLQNLRELRSLDLHLLKITDAGLVYLKGLTQLERLNLTYAPITDAGLPHLEGLRKLRWMGLIYTNVTAAGIAKLEQALPHLAVQSSSAH